MLAAVPESGSQAASLPELSALSLDTRQNAVLQRSAASRRQETSQPNARTSLGWNRIVLSATASMISVLVEWAVLPMHQLT